MTDPGAAVTDDVVDTTVPDRLDLDRLDLDLLAAIATVGPLEPSRIGMLAAAVEQPVQPVRRSLDRLISRGLCQMAPLACASRWRPDPPTAQRIARRALDYLRSRPDGRESALPVERARVLLACGDLDDQTLETALRLIGELEASDPEVSAGLHLLVATITPDHGVAHRLRAQSLLHRAGLHRRAIELFERFDLSTMTAAELDAACAVAASACIHAGDLPRAHNVLAIPTTPGARCERVAAAARFFSDPTFVPADLMVTGEEPLASQPVGVLAIGAFAAAIRGDLARSGAILDQAFVAARSASLLDRDLLAISACSANWSRGDLQAAADQALELIGSSSAIVSAMAKFLYAACAMWQGDDQPALDLGDDLGTWPTLDLIFGPIVIRARAMSGDDAAARALLKTLLTLAHQAQDHPLSARVLAVAFEFSEGEERLDRLADLRQLAVSAPCPLTEVTAAWAQALVHGSLDQLEDACRMAKSSGLWLEALRALLAARQQRIDGLERSLWWTQLKLWSDRQMEIATARAWGIGRSELDELSPADRQLAQLIVAGKRHEEIAIEMYLSVGTVRVYASRLYRRLGVTRRDQLARVIGLALPADRPIQ